MKIVCLLSIIMLVYSCCYAQVAGESFPPLRSSYQFDMAAELQQLAKSDTFPIAFGHKSYQGLLKLKHDISRLNSPSLIHIYEQQLALFYLWSGYPDSAITVLEGLPDVSFKGSDNGLAIMDRDLLLGICWLVKAELDNCRDNHNSSSCIVPFSKQAVHTNIEGSSQAIVHFDKLIAKDENDIIARWLRSIAYITLDTIPSYMPYKYLINLGNFPQDTTLGRFQNIAGDLGVDLQSYYGSAIVEDFNGDGREDIFTASTEHGSKAALYNRQHDGSFMDMAMSANVDDLGMSSHAVQADYNNDGYIDMYLLRGGWEIEEAAHLYPNSLLKNNGDGTFTDVTAHSGLLHYAATHTASWADIDGDGWLDLFVGVENFPSKMYRNKGDGTFEEVSAQVGIAIDALVKGCFWGDLNKDGHPDLYVSVYGGDNMLFMSKGLQPTGGVLYSNVAKKWKVQKPYNGFGVAMFDRNNDGYLDIFSTNYNRDMEQLAKEYIGQFEEGGFPSMYDNQAGGGFTDVASWSGLGRSVQAMGLNFADIDNDGYIDVYAGTGFPDLKAQIPNLLLLNKEGDLFKESRSSGLGHLQKTHGICFADLDHDGDLDVYASIGGFYVPDRFWNALFENPGNDNNWISMELEGVKANRSAIGAKITISIGDKLIYREVNTGGSYGSNPLRQHIGLGTATLIDKIEIVWPGSNTVTVLENVPVNTAFQLKEVDTALTEVEYAPIPFKKAEQDHQHMHMH